MHEPERNGIEELPAAPRLFRHLREELEVRAQHARLLPPPVWYRDHIPEPVRKVARVGIRVVQHLRGMLQARGQQVQEEPREATPLPPRLAPEQAIPTSTNEPILFPLHAEPLVSILILNYNRPEQLAECLESLQSHTLGISYELILADNASTAPVESVLRRVVHGRVLRFRENLGFVRGNNAAAVHVRGRYLLLLNNDTILTANWLPPLVRTITTYPRCGAVGPRFLYPDGRMQEAGSICWANGHVNQCGIKGDAGEAEHLHVREVDYVSGACLLIRTELFQRLGGFDDRYAPCYYEDVDLCFGVRAAGQRVVYQPASVIFHHGPSETALAKTVAQCEINRERFVRKWESPLNQRIVGQRPEDLIGARDLRAGTRVLIVAEPTSFWPEQAAARGQVVTFLPFGCGGAERHFPLRQAGIEVLPGDAMSLEKLMTQRVGCFEAIVLGPGVDGGREARLKKGFPATPIYRDIAAVGSVPLVSEVRKAG